LVQHNSSQLSILNTTFIITIVMASRNNSVAVQNANIKHRADQVAQQVEAEASWIERKLRPSQVAARYPIKGAALLYATCGFGSLGDALFGYNSGSIDLTPFSNANMY
jgi:hypothetical protein